MTRVPTKHRRLGVARDPELERALDETRPLLDDRDTRSAAAQVRALALRGAEAVRSDAGSGAQVRRMLVEKYAARPATRLPGSVPPPSDGVDPADPRPASDALRWVRGE